MVFFGGQDSMDIPESHWLRIDLNALHLQIDVPGYEQVPTCAWMTEIIQHQCESG